MVANRILSVSFLIFFCFLANFVWADSLNIDTTANSIVDSISTEIQSVTEKPVVDSMPTFFEKLFSDDGLPYVGIIVLLLIFIWWVFSFIGKSLDQNNKTIDLSTAAAIKKEELKEIARATKGTAKYTTIVLILGY